ncbi:MAG: nitrile hydratase accessory protein [Alkalilacustris sp.]
MSPPDPTPERPFAEPWQAQAFALTVALHAQGQFTWPQWAAALSHAMEGAAQDGSEYHDRWLVALERLLADQGAAAPDEVAALAAAWQRAARATPHGQPIALENDPAAAG